MTTPTPRLRKTTPMRGFLKLVLRAPLLLYRAGLGRLLGSRFLMLAYIGRKSGRLRRTVLEVIRRDDAAGTFIICSGWGGKSQWFRNIVANPAVWVTVAARTEPMIARHLSSDEAEREFRSYASRYPRFIRSLSRLFLGRTFTGDDADFAALSHDLPVVELGPRRETR